MPPSIVTPRSTSGKGPPILKADGTVEVFDPIRLKSSLVRAGSGPHAADRIAEQIERSIVPGAASKEIYARAFALLRKEARPVAARYALRRALLELGPSGHPFEDFVSKIFRREGWKVETRKIIQGKCVAHEVDFYATKENPARPDGRSGGESIAAELKYHNDPAYKTDVKVALYVKARFDDIWQCDPRFETCPVNRGILVTNTKFTSEAIAYGTCAGIELLGWDYPRGEGLLDVMYRTHVYPVTTLTSLSHAEKRLLVDQGLVTVGDILEGRSSLDFLRMTPERVGDIRSEAEGLMNLEHSF